MFAAVLRGDPLPTSSSTASFPAFLLASFPASVPASSTDFLDGFLDRGLGELDFVGRERELGGLLDLGHASSCASSAWWSAATAASASRGSPPSWPARSGDRCHGARARCYETERSLFLQPIIEVVREAMATLTPDVMRHAVGDRVRSLTTLVPELATIAGGDGPDDGSVAG